jgi:hypothetical protein
MEFSAMKRFAIVFAVVASAVAAALAPAQAQVVQYQYTPPPPIMQLPSSSAPSYGYSGLPSPAPALGHHSSLHRFSHGSTRYVQTHHGRVVAVSPGRPGYNTFSDRVSRCMQAGSQAGIGASQQGAFTAQCAN